MRSLVPAVRPASARALPLALAALLAALLALAPASALAGHGAGPHGDLVVDQTDSPDPVLAGSGGGVENLTYVVTLRNAGPAPLGSARVTETLTLPDDVTLGSVTPSQGTWDGASGTWTPGALLPSASATLTLRLSVPATVADGARVRGQAVATLTDALEGDANPANDAAAVSTLVQRPGAVDVAPAAHDFGGVAVGSASEPAPFTLTNAGGLDVTFDELALEGAGASAYEIVSDACSLETLAPGEACVTTVRFAPAATGAAQARLVAPSDAPEPAQGAELTGTGSEPPPTGPVAELSPAEVDFGELPVGDVARAELTLANAGDAPLPLGETTIEQDGEDFSVEGTTCTPGEALAPGEQCAVEVAFAPTERGERSGTLRVATGGGAEPASAPLAGTGLLDLRFDRDAVDFGAAPVGGQSDPARLTVTNVGEDEVELFGAYLLAGRPEEFGIVADGCDTTLGPGESCAVDAVFAPSLAEASETLLAVDTDAVLAPFAVHLSGRGEAARPRDDGQGPGGAPGGGAGDGGGQGQPRDPGAGGPPATAAGPQLLRLRAPSLAGPRIGRRGVLLDSGLALRCPATMPGSCAARAVATGPAARGGRRPVLGRATLRTAPGRSARVRLRLARRALLALPARRRVRVTLHVTVPDASGRASTTAARLTVVRRGARLRVLASAGGRGGAR